MSKLSKLLVPTEIHLAANKSLLVEMCFNGEIVLSFCHKKDFPPTFAPAFFQEIENSIFTDFYLFDNFWENFTENIEHFNFQFFTSFISLFCNFY